MVIIPREVYISKLETMIEEGISQGKYETTTDCPTLMSAVDEFIEQNVEEIYHKKDFFQLPRLQIELATTNERQKESIDSVKLCKVAINWAHKQLEVRKVFLFILTSFHLRASDS